MKFISYDIVFQEIPGEVTLAFNLSGCPNRCMGCHSPHLQNDTGDELTESVLSDVLKVYENAITCICFMGGDNSPENVLSLAKFARQFHKRIAWYSGNSNIYKNARQHFDYIKLGNYVEELGGLNSPTTNQRLYRIENETMIDMTEQFFVNHKNHKANV